MIRLGLWCAAGLAMLAGTLVMVMLPDTGDAGSSRAATTRISPADLVLGGIPLKQTDAEGVRDPFRYAPMQQSPQGDGGQEGRLAITDEAGASWEDMALEGILLRNKQPVAFIRVEGERLALSPGDAVAERYQVERIEQGSVTLSSPRGASRQLYLYR